MRSLVAILLCCFVTRAHAQLPREVDLFSGSADLTVLGARVEFGKVGWATDVGDINGDGDVDLVVYACGESPVGRQGVGTLRIVWGPIAGDVIDLQESPATVLVPPSGVRGLFANLVVGDLNGDGKADIVFTAPCDPNCDGTAYIVYGATAFPDTFDLAAPSAPITVVRGTPGDWLGVAVTLADLNDDGKVDLVLGAPYGYYRSSVYVLHGELAPGEVVDMNVAIVGVTRIIDPEPGWATGRSLASGDVDGDGVDDLLIGSPGDIDEFGQGKGTLVFGNVFLPDTVNVAVDTAMLVRIYPDETYTRSLGTGVAIGDYNGDGFGDIAISSPPAWSNGCYNCGAVFVFEGGPALPDSIHVNDTNLRLAQVIGTNDQYYGTAILFDDFSGDGFGDLVVASDPLQPEDTVVVAISFGSPTPPETVFVASDTTLTRIYGSAETSFGANIFGPTSGDLTGDGIADLFIGETRFDIDGVRDAGKVHVVYGVAAPPPTPAPLPPSIALSQNAPNPFGRSTRIAYELSAPSNVGLSIFNVLGQRISYRSLGVRAAGPHDFDWDGRNDSGARVPSGVYFYQIESAFGACAKKMVVVR